MTDKFVYYVDLEQNVLAWQVRGDLTLPDMPAIIEAIQSSLNRLEMPVKLLIDNRQMLLQSGLPLIFTREVNDVWRTCQLEILDDCEKSAVLCNGRTMKQQMDVLAKSSGLHRIQQHIWDPDPHVVLQTAYDFLGITGNALLDGAPTPKTSRR